MAGTSRLKRTPTRLLSFNSTKIWMIACFSLVLLFQTRIFFLVQSPQNQTTGLVHVLPSPNGFPIFGHHDSLSTSKITSSSSFVINPILRHMHFDSDHLFSVLLANHPNPTDTDYVLEVGCFSLSQSAFASSEGFRVISFDPSSPNFARMEETYQTLPEEQKQLMELVNKAVSSKSGEKLVFSTAGGTGDHVAGVNLDQREHRKASNKRKGQPISSVEVETVALDDAIDNILSESDKNSIYMVKIDVQGHEASVLKGLKKSLGKVRYILLEYWVDALDQAKGVPMGSCTSVQDILTPLHEAGYDLFDLSIQMHPEGEFPFIKNAHSADFFRPIDPLQHCKWFASRGKQAREEYGYQMGYWTDILAVNRNDFGAEEMGDLTLQGRAQLFVGKNYVKEAESRPGQWNKKAENRRANGLRRIEETK